MAKKNKGGRPTVITPEVIAKLDQAFAIDCTVEEACAYADISRDAFYDYLKRNPKYSDRIEKLRQRPVLAARERVVKGVKENYSNAMDYLKRKKKMEFGDASEVTIRVPKPIDDVLSDIEDVQKDNSLQEDKSAEEED